MSHPLKECTANATCPVCRHLFSITSCGVLRVHGPLSNRCAGSGQFPLSSTQSAGLPPSSIARGPDTATATTASPERSPSSLEARTVVLSPARLSVDHSSLYSPGLTSLARLNNSDTVVEHDVTQADTAILDRSENSFSAFLDMLDEA